MPIRKLYWLYFRQRFFCLILVTLICAPVLRSAAADSVGGWTAPSATTIKKVGELPSDKPWNHFFDNIDCTNITYRMTNNNEMTTGCFTSSSVGLIKEGGQTVIFNGTDEGIRLNAYSPTQTIVPWIGGNALIVLNPVATGGDVLGIYRNPLASLKDYRVAGQLLSKDIVTSFEPLKSSSGLVLIVNPQTLAFSRNGEWLVAETLRGSFVRINRTTLEVMPFASIYSTSNSDRLFNSEVAVSDDGQYAAIYNEYAAEFIIYRLSDCGPSTSMNLQLPPLHCAYFNYFSSIKKQLSAIGAVRQVRFLNNSLLQFDVITSTDSDQKGVYELSPNGSTGPLINYLAMGDSYTSGEGAFDYLSGTDTGLNKCHLSIRSYPFLILSGGKSVACSGAVIRDVGSVSSSYHGQAQGSFQSEAVLSGFLPGYLPQHNFVARYQPSVASVSVGGNDIGFGTLLRHCIMPGTCYSSYEDRLEVVQLIDRTVLRLTDLYRQIMSEAPATRLYAIGYPQVANKDGDCGVNVQLNHEELDFTEQIIDYLNGSIRQAASNVGAIFVDVSHALDGHRLCESPNVAVNGLTAGNDIGPIGHEGYHPNALGHALIAQSIASSTNSLSLKVIDPYTAPSDSQLLQAPKSNRQIVSLNPVTDMVNDAVRAGDSTVMHVQGNDFGLTPLSSYELKFDGASIGTIHTDDFADINGTINIPAGVSPGVHFIDLVGKDQTDHVTDISQAVDVTTDSSPSILIKINKLRVSG